jgi:hypothetical protein
MHAVGNAASDTNPTTTSNMDVSSDANAWTDMGTILNN